MRIFLVRMVIALCFLAACTGIQPAHKGHLPTGIVGFIIETQYESYGQSEFDRVIKNYDTMDKTAWNEFSKDLKTVVDVNEKINSLPYISDPKNYNKDDYWAAPQEMIAHGGGDCEDYAIAKYYALQQMGFDEKDLRILVVGVPKEHGAHAVLLINNSLVLTNGYSEIYPLAVYVNSGIFEPWYSINKEGIVRYAP